MIESKWLDALGRFVLDVGKYVITAIVLGTFISEKEIVVRWLAIILVMSIIMIVLGLILIGLANPAKKKDSTSDIKKAIIHVEHAEFKQ